MATLRKTIEQGRAKSAYDSVKTYVDANKGKSTLDNYKSYSKKIPTMIKTSGLGATLAFMKSKKKEYDVIYNDIAKWLGEDFKMKSLFQINKDNFLDTVLNIDYSSVYRALTIEVVAYMNWHRRFAEGMIEKNKDKNKENDNKTSEK